MLALGKPKLCEWLARLCKTKFSKRSGEHFAYLEALASYRQGHQKDALEHCERAIAEGSDPRQLLLASYLLWQESGADGLAAPALLERAIRYAEKGFVSSEATAKMKLSLANNIAFFLALQGTGSSIENARVWLKNMSMLVSDEDEWHANWLDTMGFVDLQEAKVVEDPLERNRLLSSAINHFEKGLTHVLDETTCRLINTHRLEVLALR